MFLWNDIPVTSCDVYICRNIYLLGFTITMVKTIVFAIIFIIILFKKVASISTKLHR